MRRLPTAVLGALLFVSCSAPSAESSEPVDCSRSTAVAPTMVRSPGGTLEVTPTELAANHCGVRIVDVREREELADGVLPWAEHIPAARVLGRAQGWDRDAPVVLVCRSGRRSGRVARELEELGFTHVASLTGGMLAWSGLQLPMATAPAETRRRSTAARKRPLSASDVQRHVADHTRVRWTKAATLLMDGTQACVDGRDASGIIGTPGGDAGELVLALSVAEQHRGAPLTRDEIRALFDAYLEAFGHFYLHSDEHAADHLAQEVLGRAVSPSEAEALLRRPPAPVREKVLAAVSEAHNVGCGHLRLSLQHPEAYGVREAIVRAVIEGFFERLWAGDERLEFVVLEGSHGESGVVIVELSKVVHAYTLVPMLSPRVQDTEVFVLHPEVARFVRSQNAAFLLEEVPALAGLEEAAFVEALDALGNQQLSQTVQRLAPGLPTYHVHFEADGFRVETR